MNARFAHVLSRLSLVSVITVSALGAAACARARPGDTQPAAVEQVQAAPAAHGPGYRMFRQIEGLELRAEQRVALAEIEQGLAAEMAPHRQTMRAIAATLA